MTQFLITSITRNTCIRYLPNEVVKAITFLYIMIQISLIQHKQLCAGSKGK